MAEQLDSAVLQQILQTLKDLKTTMINVSSSPDNSAKGKSRKLSSSNNRFEDVTDALTIIHKDAQRIIESIEDAEIDKKGTQAFFDERLKKLQPKSNSFSELSKSTFGLKNVMDSLTDQNMGMITSIKDLKTYLAQLNHSFEKNPTIDKQWIKATIGTQAFNSTDVENMMIKAQAARKFSDARTAFAASFSPDAAGNINSRSFATLPNLIHEMTEQQRQQFLSSVSNGTITSADDYHNLLDVDGKLGSLYRLTSRKLNLDTDINEQLENNKAANVGQLTHLSNRYDTAKLDEERTKILEEMKERLGISTKEAQNTVKLLSGTENKQEQAEKIIDDLNKRTAETQGELFKKLIGTVKQGNIDSISSDTQNSLMLNKTLQTNGAKDALKSGSKNILDHTMSTFLGIGLREFSIVDGIKDMITGLSQTLDMFKDRVQTGTWQGMLQSSLDSWTLGMGGKEVTELNASSKPVINSQLFKGGIKKFDEYLSRNSSMMIEQYGSLAAGEKYKASALNTSEDIGLGKQNTSMLQSYYTGIGLGSGYSGKTFGMTADEYAKVAHTMMENEGVQKSLVGLHKQQRVAVEQSILQQFAFYKAMGLSTSAAEHAATAMRDMAINTPVTERIQEAARVSQLAMFEGYSAGTAMRLRDDWIHATQLQHSNPAEFKWMQNTLMTLQNKMTATGNTSMAKQLQLQMLHSDIVSKMLGGAKDATEMANRKPKEISPNVALADLGKTINPLPTWMTTIIQYLDRIKGILDTGLGKIFEGALLIVGAIATSRMIGGLIGGAGNLLKKTGSVALDGIKKVGRWGRLGSDAAAAGEGTAEVAAGEGTAEVAAAAEAGGDGLLAAGAGALAIPGLGEILAATAAVAGVGYLGYKAYEYLTSPSTKNKNKVQADTIIKTAHESDKYHGIIQNNLTQILANDKQKIQLLTQTAENTAKSTLMLKGVYDLLYDEFVNKSDLNTDKKQFQMLKKRSIPLVKSSGAIS